MSEHTSALLGLEVREVWRQGDLAEIYAIRDEVFVDEQQLTDNSRNDPDDRKGIHYLAYVADEPVGAGRLTLTGREAQVAWLAVRPRYRRSGVGWALMESMIARAERELADYVILNAQSHALDFYRRLGFNLVGSEFTMSGIPHHVMVKSLTNSGGDSVHGFSRQYNG
jgi:predicted GNAT family N-acyltransferase